MPFMRMEHAEDPAQKLLEELGDLSTVEVFNNQLLVAVYIRPPSQCTFQKLHELLRGALVFSLPWQIPNFSDPGRSGICNLNYLRTVCY